MKDFTTIEKLQMKVNATYGSVLKFGDNVLVADAHYKGGFTADIYEFVETPEGSVSCTDRLRLATGRPFFMPSLGR